MNKKQLKRLRMALFLSRSDLAKLVHVSPVLIKKIETGDRKLTPELSEAILRAFWNHSGKLSKQLSNVRLTIVSMDGYKY